MNGCVKNTAPISFPSFKLSDFCINSFKVFSDIAMHNRTESDADSVRKLRAAGVNIFGKTNVPLDLADFQSYNDIYGTTNNPYSLDRIPGGSSGGSAAALAAGLTGLETGSDIGGSIRNPAHFCGVFGHKPTFDLLWRKGHSPVSYTHLTLPTKRIV